MLGAICAACLIVGIASISQGEKCDPDGGLIKVGPIEITRCHDMIVFGIVATAIGGIMVLAVIAVLVRMRRPR